MSLNHLLRVCRTRGRAFSTAVAAPGTTGLAHASAKGTPGQLYIWGKIDDHKIGMNLSHMKFGAQALALGPSIPPTLHTGITVPLTSVVCRATKTLALAADGSVYTWGMCKNFSLGHGNLDVVPRPKKLEALDGIKIVKIAAGETSSAALSDEGEIFTWGWGGSWWDGNGGLGHGNRVTQPRPALVESLSNQKVKLVDIAVGNGHMYALSDTGAVFSWGNGEYGRCGNGKQEQLVPEPIEVLQDKKVVQIASGQLHGLALTATGDIWAWGKNDAGQLGVGASIMMDLNTMEEYPLLVEPEGDDKQRFVGKAVAIAAGAIHSLALLEDGTVYQWGQRTFLQPQPVEYGYLKPTGDDDVLVEKDKANGVRLRGVAIAAGDGVSGVVHENGDLFTWGKNLNTGTLGHTLYGAGTRRPARVDQLHGTPISDVSFGSRHAAAVVSNAAPSRPVRQLK